jgi:hypothetical protein
MKVKKEVTVAVVIGLFLALIVTGGVLRAQSAIRSLSKNSKVAVDVTSSPVPKSNGLFLDITTPDNTVLKDPKFTLTGKTLPGTYIAILSEKGEYLIVPSDVGSFSQYITLIKGANTIKITVYENDGTKVDKTLSAVYTTAEI